METLFTTIKEKLQLGDKKILEICDIVEGMIKAKSVNLNEISIHMNPKIKRESNYRKLQRFLRDFNVVYGYIAKILISLIPKNNRILVIDRTEWKGVNIFYLGIYYQGVTIPILWDVLDKKGTSNTLERISLIEDYINLFGIENIDLLLADREFIGKEWFDWLKENKIKFMIRLKSNFILERECKKKKKVKGIYRYYHEKEEISKVFGIELKVMGKRINKKEILILATNCNESVIEEYSKRWSIENMFSCLKTKGFNLESTKINESYKLEKLLAIVNIAYCWCIVTGKYYRKKDSSYRKDLGYYSKSIFKIGLERLRKSIFDKHLNPKEYERVYSLFSPYDKLFI